MPTATMTSKGQVTIPVQVRKALGLKPGVRIDFYELEDGEYALRARTGTIMEMRGCLANAGLPITVEEMNQAILDHAEAQDRASKSDAAQNLSYGDAA